jgi:hypothetical protein
MARPKPLKPKIVTYGDYELIKPDTRKLHSTLRDAAPDEPDPVALAEEALAQIACEFSKWMNLECDRLDNARRNVKKGGLSKETKQELFLAAHDLRGDSELFGFPAVAPAADSLCRLLEHSPNLRKIPVTIVDQHVDAVRAIVREYARKDTTTVAAALTRKLREVTDEFLMRENRRRPEVLRVIRSPALAPSEAF